MSELKLRPPKEKRRGWRDELAATRAEAARHSGAEAQLLHAASFAVP